MTTENRTLEQAVAISMTAVNHGENGVTVVARDKVGRNPVFHFVHSSAPKAEVGSTPSAKQTSGVNDVLNIPHPKP